MIRIEQRRRKGRIYTKRNRNINRIIINVVILLPGTECARVEDGGNELLLDRVAVLGVVDKVARRFCRNKFRLSSNCHKQAADMAIR